MPISRSSSLGDHRHALYPPPLHQLDDVRNRIVRPDRHNGVGHYLADLPAVCMRVFTRQAARRDQEFEPAGTPSLGAGLGPPQQIAFGHDADNLAGGSLTTGSPLRRCPSISSAASRPSFPVLP